MTASVRVANRTPRQASPGSAEVQIERDRVAESALSLMSEGGIRAVTLRGVARLLRVPAARVQRQYPTDASIITALLDYIEQKLADHVRQAGTGDTDAIGRLERLIARSCDPVMGDARLLSTAFAAALAVGTRHRAARQRLVAILMGYLKDVSDIVRDGQRLAQIRSDVDAGTVALLYLGLIQPAAILSHVSGGDFDLRNHVQRSFALFRDAIAV